MEEPEINVLSDFFGGGRGCYVILSFHFIWGWVRAFFLLGKVSFYTVHYALCWKEGLIIIIFLTVSFIVLFENHVKSTKCVRQPIGELFTILQILNRVIITTSPCTKKNRCSAIYQEFVSIKRILLNLSGIINSSFFTLEILVL